MRHLEAFCLVLLLAGCSVINSAQKEPDIRINEEEFNHLLNTVAKGWNQSVASVAADCFTQDAVYIEPPDRQLYQGRSELFNFFGGDKGRVNPMTMTWHNIIFDANKQIGTGEYTFGYKGKLTHGIVIIQIKQRKISRWREYQYRTNIDWNTFIGDSAF